MLLRTLALLAGLCLATPALAQTSTTLDAAPVALIDAEINGRPVRLEVDPRMPDMLALSTPAAERLGVRRLPFAQVQVGIEGGGSMRGRIARPNIRFGARAARNLAGIFPVPVSTRADGVIGPGSPPYDIVTLRLSDDAPTHRDIVLPLENADLWYTQAQSLRIIISRLQIVGMIDSNRESSGTEIGIVLDRIDQVGLCHGEATGEICKYRDDPPNQIIATAQFE